MQPSHDPAYTKSRVSTDKPLHLRDGAVRVLSSRFGDELLLLCFEKLANSRTDLTQDSRRVSARLSYRNSNAIASL